MQADWKGGHKAAFIDDMNVNVEKSKESTKNNNKQ